MARMKTANEWNEELRWCMHVLDGNSRYYKGMLKSRFSGLRDPLLNFALYCNEQAAECEGDGHVDIAQKFRALASEASAKAAQTV